MSASTDYFESFLHSSFYKFFYPAFHTDPLSDNRIRDNLKGQLNLNSYRKTVRPESAGSKSHSKKKTAREIADTNISRMYFQSKGSVYSSIIFENLEQTVLF